MNKIYKVIWSKAKNCYVVASELAKSHTKAPKSGIMSHALVAGVLACVMSCGAVIPVHAADLVGGQGSQPASTSYGSSGGSISGKTATVNAGTTISGSVYGAKAGSGIPATPWSQNESGTTSGSGGSATSNTAKIYGTVTGAVYGGLGGYGCSPHGGSGDVYITGYAGSGGSANSNQVIVSGGTVDGVIYGGVAGVGGGFRTVGSGYNNSDSMVTSAGNGGTANNNTITISNNSSVGNIYLAKGGNVTYNYNDSNYLSTYASTVTHNNGTIRNGGTAGNANNNTLTVSNSSVGTTITGAVAGTHSPYSVGSFQNASNAGSVRSYTASNWVTGNAEGNTITLNNVTFDVPHYYDVTSTVSATLYNQFVTAYASNPYPSYMDVINGTISYDVYNMFEQYGTPENFLAQGYEFDETSNNYIRVEQRLSSSNSIQLANAGGGNQGVSSNYGTTKNNTLNFTGQLAFKGNISGYGSYSSNNSGTELHIGGTKSGGGGAILQVRNELDGSVTNQIDSVRNFDSVVIHNAKWDSDVPVLEATSVSGVNKLNVSDTKMYADANGIYTKNLRLGSVDLLKSNSNLSNMSVTYKNIDSGTSYTKTASALASGEIVHSGNYSDTYTPGYVNAENDDTISMTTGTFTTTGTEEEKLKYENNAVSLAVTKKDADTAVFDGSDWTEDGDLLQGFSSVSSMSLLNNSNINATGDATVGTLSLTDSKLSLGGNLTSLSISDSGTTSTNTLSAIKVETTEGDINASNTDVTATDAVESAGVVKLRSLNAPRLLGAGSGMSTLGGGLTVAGQVKGVTAGTADTDAVNVAQLNSAIAGASTPYIGVNGTSGLPNENGSGASGSNSIAIGTSASASTDLAIALGASTSVLALDSTAIGYQAKVNNGATNSVALGGGSETTEANTVSVGNSTTRRRIVNVADGTNDHDVATVGQLNSAIAGVSGGGSTPYIGINGMGSNQDGSGAQGANAIAIGAGALSSGLNAVTLGTNSLATGDSAAVGIAAKTYGTNSVAIGSAAFAGTDVNGEPTSATHSNIALGSSSRAYGNYAVALGTGAQSTAENAVAIGSNSIADTANTVSVGSSTTQRKIVNVANGTAANDAATYGQVSSTLKGLTASGQTITYTKVDGTTGTITTQDTDTTYSAGNGISLSGTTFSAKPYNGITVDSNGIGVKAGTNVTVDSNGVNVTGNGTVASGNTGLISGGTLFTEGRITADGQFAKKANSVATNITALDTAAKNAIKGLSVSGTTITYTKGDGTTGTITTQDNDTTYDNMVASELNTGTATTARSISAKVLADYVTGKVSAETTARTTAINTEASTRANADTALGTRIDNVTSAYQFADTDLSNRVGSVASDGTFIKKSATNDVATNLTALDTAAKNAIKGLSVSGQTITYTKGDGTTGTITTQDNDTTYTTGTSAQLTAGTDTTGQVWGAKTISDFIASKVDTATGGLIDNNSTTHLYAGSGTASNATTTNGNTKITIADDSTVRDNVTIKGTGATTVTSDANGVITIDSTDNDTTYTAGNGLELSGTQFKAKAGTNVTVDANGISVVGNGSIASGNTGLVSGGTAYSELRPSANGTYVKIANTTAQNLTALDTQLKTTTDNLATEVTNRTNAVSGEATTRTNADTALSNRIGTISADGNYIKKSDTKNVSENLSLLDAQLKSVADNVSSESGNTVHYDASAKTKITLEGSGGTTISNVKDATLSATSTEAVTGKQLFATNNAIATETTNRTNVDTALQGSINDEISARQTAIATEKSERESADATLQTNISNEVTARETAVSAEATARSEADALLQTNISDEVTARQQAITDEATVRANADSALQTNIDNEVTARQEAITSEATVRADADAQLLTNISDEVSARETAITNEATIRADEDTALSNRIDALSGNAVHYDGDAKTKVTLEGSDGTIIDNVKDGTLSASSKEAVNGSQLYTTNQALAQEVTDRTTAVLNEATVRSTEDTNLSNRIGSVSADGNYIKASSTKNVAENLGLLDTAVKANADAISQEITNRTTAVSNEATARANAINSEATTRADADTALGTRIDNVITNYQSADTALSNRIDALDGNSVQYDSSDKGKITFEGTNGTILDNVKAGTLSATSKEAVNGSQLYTTNQNLANEISARESADTTLQTNITAEQTARTSADTALGTRIDNVITNYETADTALSNRIGTISADGNYIKASNSKNISENLGLLDTQVKANADAIALETSNRTTAVTNEATARQNADTALNTRVDNAIKGLSVDGRVITYTRGDNSTGTITTQDTTYTAGNGLTLTDTEFTAKAGTNVVVDENGINVAGNGTIAENDTGLISGGTLYSEVHLANNGTYIRNTRTTARNLRELDTQVATNAGAITQNATNIDNLKNLSNLSEEGQTVIMNLAKGSINVANGTNAEVVKTDVEGVDTYTVNVAGNGVIEEDNTGLVSGGTVYQALQTQTLNSQSLMDDKADIDASNVTDAQSWADKLGTGTIDGTDTKLVTGATVASETRITDDGNYVTSNKTIAENVSVLDTQVKTNATNISANTTAINTNTADIANLKDMSNLSENGQAVIRNLANSSIDVVGADKATVTKTSVNGTDTYTVSVKADGTVAENNENLVTGGAVYTALQNTQETLQTNINSRLNRSLSNIREEGQTTIRGLAQEAVKVVDGTNTTVVEDVNGNAKTYAVNVTTDGTVASGNTGIVTGGTVYQAIHDAIAGSETGVGTELATKANSDASNVTDAQAWATKIGTGIVSESDGKLVTGSTVAGETRVAEDGNYVLADKTAGQNLVILDEQVKANTDAVATNTSDITNLKNMSSLSEAGQTAVKDLAKASVNVTGSGKATVTKSDVDGVNTYNVEVLGNGEVAENNENLVTGGVVHTAIQSAIATSEETLTTQINRRASRDASNITNIQPWADKLGVGTIDSADNNLVKGSTVAGETRVAEDGNYVQQASTAGQNISLLDTQVKANADSIGTLQTSVSAMSERKVDAGLANINDDGQGVIRGIAQDSVKVIAGTSTSVTEGTDGDIKTYAVNVDKSGIVANGNENLVTGGVVYSAIQDALESSGVGSGIDLTVKANTDASNIDASVWSTKLNTGTVAENDTGLVSGGKVYSAIESAKSDLATSVGGINDTLMTKTNTDLDNLSATGTNVIRSVAKDVVKVANGSNTTVVLETDADGNVTYKVTANATGTVSHGDTGLVSGGAVHDAILSVTENVVGIVDGVLDTKVDTSASNIGVNADVDNSESWGRALGSGEVAEGNNKLVKGSTVFQETRVASDGNYVQKNNSAGSNLSALDTQVKANADDIASLKDMSDISTAGQEVIGDIAQDKVEEETRVSSNGNYVQAGATASENMVTLDTALKDVSNTVTNVSNDVTNLSTNVTNLMSDMTTVSGDVVNLKDMSNITDAGKTVIRNLAQDSVKVVSGTNANVTSAVAEGKTTYTVNVVADGTVANGNTGLVTGGAVYSAINSAVEDIVSGSAVTDELVNTVANRLGTGTIEAGNTGYVTGGAVYDAINERMGSTNIGTDVTEGTAYGEGATVNGNGGTAVGDSSEAGGTNAVAVGQESSASGDNSTSVGTGSSAEGTGATALGGDATSEGNGAVAIGTGSEATGEGTTAIGAGSNADGTNALAVGGGSEASNVNTTSVGTNSVASAEGASAFGNSANADGESSTAVGTNTTASGTGALAVGSDASAVENYATAVGNDASASNSGASAFGDSASASGENSIALGTGTGATAENASAVGYNANSIGENASAFGANAAAVSEEATAIGAGSTAQGQYATAVGADANATSKDTVAVGNTAIAGAEGATALGSDSVAAGNDSMALGRNTVVTGTNSVALGTDSTAFEENVISLGHKAGESSSAGTSFSSDLKRRIINVADGTSASDAATVGQIKEYVNGSHTTMTADGQNTIGQDRYILDVKTDGQVTSGNTGIVTGGAVYEAIRNLTSIGGGTVETGTQDAIAVGDNSAVSGDNSVAVGTGSTVEGGNSTAVGTNSEVTGNSSAGFGNDTSVTGEGSVAVGTGSTVSGDSSTAMGNSSTATGNNAVAVGDNANAESNNAVAVGSGSEATGEGAVSIGTGTSVTGADAVALGSGAEASADDTVAIGNDSTVSGAGAVGLGTDTNVTGNDAIGIGGSSTASGDGAVALGSGSQASNEDTVSIGSGAIASGEGSAVLGAEASATGTNAVALGTDSVASDDNVVSLGHTASDVGANGQAYGSDLFRRIANVADGTSAHDAATVGQTYVLQNSNSTIVREVGTNDIGQKIYQMDINIDGQIAEGNTGLVSGGDIYEAIRALGSTAGGTVSGDVQDGTAVGGGSTVSADDGVAVGSGSTSSSEGAVAVGTNSSSTGNSGVAVGTGSNSSSEGAVAIGSGATSGSNGAVAVGTDSNVTGDNSVAIGNNSVAEESNSIALGGNSTVTSSDAIAVGNSSSVTASDGVAIGSNATSSSEGATAVGSGSEVKGTDGVGIGNNAYVENDNSVAIGGNSAVTGDNAVALGNNATVSADQGTALGSNSQVTGEDGVAVGRNAQVTANDAVAMGGNTSASAEGAVAIGDSSVAEGTNTVALGKDASATGNNATAFGGGSVASGEDAVAVGGNSIVTGSNSVALGNDSVASDSGVVSMGHKATDKDANGNEYGTDMFRKISNVADGVDDHDVATIGQLKNAGAVIADAIGNGKAEEGNAELITGDTLYQSVTELRTEIETKMPHGISVNSVDNNDTNYDSTGASGDNAIAIGPNAEASGEDGIAIGHGAKVTGKQSISLGTGNQVTGNHSGAFGDPNNVTGDGSYAFGNDNTVSGNNTFVLGNNVSNATGNNTIVLGNGSDGSMDNVVSIGSEGAERKIVHVADGKVEKNSKEAVNGGQLFNFKQALENAENVNVDKWTEKLGTGQVAQGDEHLVTGGTVYNAITNMNVAPGSITEDVAGQLHIGGSPAYDNVDYINISKSDGTGRAITGVLTDPTDATSAANVGYVNAIGQNLANATSNALNRMDTKVNKVGANAAAMASLEAPPMDGDEKWAFSAAVGHYEGETAGAVGAFYKPQDNVIVNIRGSMGNGEDMIGAGVGIALQRGASVGITKAKLAKAVNNQAQVIEAMKAERDADHAKMEQMNAEREADRARIAELERKLNEVISAKK